MALDPGLFATTFGLIFLAELPDKTAMATVVMASRKHPVAVFGGVASAFLIQSGVAVAFGSLFGLLPPFLVRLAAGGLFLAFAYVEWSRPPEPEEDIALSPKSDRRTILQTAWSAFLVIFVAEWGDLTQLATAALEAKYKKPATIFLASVCALWLVSALAAAAGHRLRRLISPARLQRLAAAAFAAAGLVLLVEALRALRGA